MASYDDVETYADHRERLKYATVLGKKMAYIDEGQGQPIVLVHGIPTSSWMFRKLIPGLVDRGYRVIVPDLIGLGASERVRDKSLLTVHGEARFMLELITGELKLDRWSQLVHDFGGPITWEMMEDRRCKIDRLIVLDTFAFEEGWKPGLNFFSKLGMRMISTRLTRKAAARKTIRGMVADKSPVTPEMLAGYTTPLRQGGWYSFKCLYFTANRLRRDLPRYQETLRRFDGPVKLIWGRQDEFLTADGQLPRLVELLDISPENVVILDDVKHLVADEAPQAILDAL